MYITNVTVCNFGAFAGEWSQDLEPAVYAVVAKHDQDSERSNWLGKTTFLSAIRFALFGKHPWDSEDEWITDNEERGGVTLTLNTGLWISRYRKRGNSTQLEVRSGLDRRSCSVLSTQAEAQVAIHEHIGIDHMQATNGPFIEQKQIARLVVAKAAERTGIINGWLDLGPIQKACKHSSGALSQAVQADQALASEYGVLANTPDEEVGGWGPEHMARLQELASLSVSLQASIDQEAERQQLVAAADEFDRVCAQGHELKQNAPPEATGLADAEATALSTRELYAEAKGAYGEAKSIVDNGFDGQCPVICETCPSKEHVADRVGDMGESLYQAEEAVDAAMGDWSRAADEINRIRTVASERAQHDTQIVQLRNRAAELAESYEKAQTFAQAPDTATLFARMATTHEETRALSLKKQSAESAATRNAARDIRMKVIAAKRTTLRGEMETLREACAVLGRHGVQRDIAQECIGSVEDMANALLRDAGIDLRVEVRWGRETKGLAANCGMCGSPFPAGRGVKECAKCGAPRGPKMIEKVHFKLSNRSGAADDMGGLAFQLAAAAWQRKATGSAWGTVLIDEPFGALDRRHVRDMSTHLHQMIQGPHGFTQGFIVAHNEAVMDAMPQRIVIESDGVHARIGGADAQVPREA